MSKALLEDPNAFDFNDDYQPVEKPAVQKPEQKTSRFIEKMKN